MWVVYTSKVLLPYIRIAIIVVNVAKNKQVINERTNIKSGLFPFSAIATKKPKIEPIYDTITTPTKYIKTSNPDVIVGDLNI
jgi:hypothetical protein